MDSIIMKRPIKAPLHKVWKVISDVANYHKVAPNLHEVKIISGSKKGMVRACSDSKGSWTETCTLWKENEEYSFEVNTKAKDYPYPLKFLKGIWAVKEISKNETLLTLKFEVEPKYKWMMWAARPFLFYKFKRVVNQLMDNWERMCLKA